MITSNLLSKKLVSILKKNDIIVHDDTEAYEFCIEYLFDVIIYNGSILILGLILHKFMLSILYILIMTPLKKLSGGFHAPTRGLCSIISYGLYFFSIVASDILSTRLLNEYNYYETTITITIFIILAVSIIIMSPVGHINKPLSPIDKRKLKKYTALDMIIIGGCMLAFIRFKMTEFIILVIICLCTNFISLVAGNLENRRI